MVAAGSQVAKLRGNWTLIPTEFFSRECASEATRNRSTSMHRRKPNRRRHRLLQTNDAVVPEKPQLAEPHPRSVAATSSEAFGFKTAVGTELDGQTVELTQGLPSEKIQFFEHCLLRSVSLEFCRDLLAEAVMDGYCMSVVAMSVSLVFRPQLVIIVWWWNSR